MSELDVTPPQQLHAAASRYGEQIAGIPDCFDYLTGATIRELAEFAAINTPGAGGAAAEADKFIRGHLDMLTRWHDALDQLDSEIRSDVVEGSIPDWAQQYLKAEAREFFDAHTTLLRAIAEYHHGSAGPLLDPAYGHAYQLSNSALSPF
jgi:hypothetical protein